MLPVPGKSSGMWLDNDFLSCAARSFKTLQLVAFRSGAICGLSLSGRLGQGCGSSAVEGRPAVLSRWRHRRLCAGFRTPAVTRRHMLGRPASEKRGVGGPGDGLIAFGATMYRCPCLRKFNWGAIGPAHVL
jgi:hypothetical protein